MRRNLSGSGSSGLLLVVAAALIVSGCAKKVAEGEGVGQAAALAGPEPLSPSPPTPYVPNGQYAAQPYKPYERPATVRRDLNSVESRPNPPTLRAPANTAPVRAASPVGGSGEGSKVVVEKGDTLFSLARRHNVKVDDLKKANNLPNETIKVGQSLVVPRS